MSDLNRICPVCGHQSKHWYDIHTCTPAPEAPSETRCDGTGGGELYCPDGCRQTGGCCGSPEMRPCEKCGTPHPPFTPPVAELSLDFWGACESAGLRRLCYRIPETMRDALNQQLREKVADAVAKERARGQELRRLVREWQEAWKVRASDPMELESECRWLAAFDLGPEGDQ